MSQPPREVEDCPYREAGGDMPSDGRAICRLVQQVSGVADARLCQVDHDTCRACTQWFQPGPRHWNPVIASRLYGFCNEVIGRGGVAGCSEVRASQLRETALDNLASPAQMAGPVANAGVPSPTAAEHVIRAALPRPRRRSGPAVRSWAVGVTTAPREYSTLAQCLESLAAAGWHDVRLLIDGPVTPPDKFADLPASRRSPQMGAWPSYYLGLIELMMRQPAADAYMLVQDDTLFAPYPGLRDYLQNEVLWPGRKPGVVSLFCSQAYTRPEPGWYRFRGIWVWCALAFIFPRHAAQRFAASTQVVQHRWSRYRNGLADIDGMVGRWVRRSRTPLHYPTPSLVQHIGHVSSMWDNLLAIQYRHADQFIGDIQPARPDSPLEADLRDPRP